jgi:hypothetical protein
MAWARPDIEGNLMPRALAAPPGSRLHDEGVTDTDPEPADPEPADPQPADAQPVDAQPADRPSRGGLRKLGTTVLWWIDPEENPSGVVYGTIAVGAVLAAESTRRDTFPDTIGATVLILALYWVAHTYAGVTGDRLKTRHTLSVRGLWRSLLHEAAIMKGAALPIGVLLVLWATPVTLSTAVTAALWTSAVALALFEMVAAFRTRLSVAQRALQVLLGSLMGAGILIIRLLLH